MQNAFKKNRTFATPKITTELTMVFPVPAQKYIPQRPPIVMIDNILENHPDRFVTDFVIRADNVFVENNLFREAGMMENIAQTCAARIGFCSADESVPIGVIGGITDFMLRRNPQVGETLTTSIGVVADMGAALVVAAEVFVNEELVATCSMKVFISQE